MADDNECVHSNGLDLPELYDMDEDSDVDLDESTASWEYPLTQKEKLNRVLLLWEKENRSLNEELGGSPRRRRKRRRSPSPRRTPSKVVGLTCSPQEQDLSDSRFHYRIQVIFVAVCIVSLMLNLVLFLFLSGVRNQAHLLSQQHAEAKKLLQSNATKLVQLQEAIEPLEKKHLDCMELYAQKDMKCDRVLELSGKLNQELFDREKLVHEKKKEVAQLIDLTQSLKTQATASSEQLAAKSFEIKRLVEVTEMLERQVEERLASMDQKDEDFARLYEYAHLLEKEYSEMTRLLNWKNTVLKHASRNSRPLWIGIGKLSMCLDEQQEELQQSEMMLDRLQRRAGLDAAAAVAK